MYGLPEKFDSSPFVGRELQQVCFWEYSVHLVFGGEVSITLDSAFRFRKDPQHELVLTEVPVTSSDLMQLVGKAVERATAQPDGTLSLCFVGGGELVCTDDSPEYESYRIRFGDKEILV